MIFSSLIFIFLFLPLTLFVYFLIKKEYRNVFLLLISLFFYAWGEGQLVILMIFSIIQNYFIGLAIQHKSILTRPIIKKLTLALGIIFNLATLIYFKYYSFILDNINFYMGGNFDNKNIALPIGISFFTFQSISYLIDVYRSTVDSQKNILNLGLYISLFPQLIAGPIVRYVDIHKEILSRNITIKSFTRGITKFITGLSKKVIIANTLGKIADEAFLINPDSLGSTIAWIGIICYALQIYFDFSGYSDMAIGLGRMFGFEFKENFIHPYIAKSVKEFWRRWHISLSTWFRDYLYIPLGGNRKSNFRTHLNLIIVFFITGLWHGASWNFIIWGLYHGLFLLLEKNITVKLPKKLNFLKHLYLIFVILIGWVFFRSETLNQSLKYIEVMFSFSPGLNNAPVAYINLYTVIIFCLAITFSCPIKDKFINIDLRTKTRVFLYNTIKNCSYLILFLYSILELIQSNYNPFIYFRF